MKQLRKQQADGVGHDDSDKRTVHGRLVMLYSMGLSR